MKPPSDSAVPGLGDYVVIIARYADPGSKEITIQDFFDGGEQFIPVFSSDEEFRKQSAGSGFEKEGLSIKRDLLHSILDDGVLLILNPGGPSPLRLRRNDLA